MRYRFLRFPGGLGKAVTLSYDDGSPEDLRVADMLTEHGFKATFNLVGEVRRRLITKEDVQAHFINNGHEIAVHGEHHAAEGVIRPIDGIRDVLRCRVELEERYDRIIRGMAYPESGVTRFVNGTDLQTVKNYLKELDIVYSRSLGGDNNSFEMPNEWYAWMPTAHHDNPNILEWIEEFTGIKMDEIKAPTRFTPKLFYIWGHGYEFERKNNWDHLSEILEALGGKEDIWYATNIEIYEYWEAYSRLVTNANHTKVYNPSCMDIWFNADGVDYKVGAGETITVI